MNKQVAALRAQFKAEKKQIVELKGEVAQYRKRDSAFRDFFVWMYKETKDMHKEKDRLEGRKDSLRAKYKELRVDQKTLESECLELEERELLFKAKLGPRNASEEAIDYHSLHGGHDPAQPRKLREINPWTAGKIGRHFGMGGPLDIWDGQPEKFHKIEKLLRKHDYYAGWLDAMQAIDLEKAIDEARLGMSAHVNTIKVHASRKTIHLLDEGLPKNPLNAGLNAGLLFAWSALCATYNLPQHDVRLDDRVWQLSDLVPFSEDTRSVCEDFWEGVSNGVDKMERLFELKLEGGKFDHQDDPEQIKHMQPDHRAIKVAGQQARVKTEAIGCRQKEAKAFREREATLEEADRVWALGRKLKEKDRKAVGLEAWGD